MKLMRYKKPFSRTLNSKYLRNKEIAKADLNTKFF